MFSVYNSCLVQLLLRGISQAKYGKKFFKITIRPISLYTHHARCIRCIRSYHCSFPNNRSTYSAYIRYNNAPYLHIRQVPKQSFCYSICEIYTHTCILYCSPIAHIGLCCAAFLIGVYWSTGCRWKWWNWLAWRVHVSLTDIYSDSELRLSNCRRTFGVG